jgi:bifunctional UDP-N-acetylglucosamine pyrophosphorylase/glucosamine-1-phosphate N-acetyltransferase
VTRLLIIPGAGIGSRLGMAVPKILAPVAGRPMLDHLLGLYTGLVDAVVVVVSPPWLDAVRDLLATRGLRSDVAVQQHPTGMLDAVLTPRSLVDAAAPDRVWITWCDQVAVRHETLRSLVAIESRVPAPAFIMPTNTGPMPYIHFARASDGTITRVLHRREGDTMPPVGESDIGVFSLSRAAYLGDLADYEAAVERGAATRERNFLPFIPWLAAKAPVTTFPCTDPIEALGINTPEDLARIEAHLRTGVSGLHA